MFSNKSDDWGAAYSVQLELDPEYHGQFRPTQLPQFRRRLEDWLTQLPKTLWELGAQQLVTTEVSDCTLQYADD